MGHQDRAALLFCIYIIAGLILAVALMHIGAEVGYAA